MIRISISPPLASSEVREPKRYNRTGTGITDISEDKKSIISGDNLME